MTMLVDESNNIRALSEYVTKGLSQAATDAGGRRNLARAAAGQNGLFIHKVLMEFDHRNHRQLQAEYRILSGAETSTSNVSMPASYQKEVIREALSDLAILQLVKTAVDPTATVTCQIPYEERPHAADIPNGGIVYEGQGIPFAGGGLRHDTAYITPMKLALKVTNEVMHFTQSSGINWQAWSENIGYNARIIRELIHRRLANEMLRASDTYMAQTVQGEEFTTDGAGIILTVKFPVIRPRQVYDMMGNSIGSPECPLTVTIGGNGILPYTGENLAPGVYWQIMDVNAGRIRLLNQDGSPAAAGVSGTISYSTPTNLMRFDLNPNGIEYRKHLNDLITMVGDQKSMMSSQRYVRPDYALMSSGLNNEISKAEQFVITLKRDGTDTTAQGDLEAIKSLPAFDTNAPGVDIADQRILIGQRGLTAYTIAKPYSAGTPFEAVDGYGRPTGEKVMYGEEYNAIHTPKPVCSRYTSILIHDSRAR